MFVLFSLLALAYLIGSVPSAVWIGKAFYGIDVREHGSRNAGATNTFRVLGRRAGIPVMAVDILKGWVATNVVFLQHTYPQNSDAFANLQIGLGLAAVAGHIYPIFARFKGGKGIATLFGFLLAINPAAAGVCLATFLVVLIIGHYVSLSSMCAGIVYPLFLVAVTNTHTVSLIVFSIAVSLLVLYTHRKNIRRLAQGTESKIYLFKKPVPIAGVRPQDAGQGR